MCISTENLKRDEQIKKMSKSKIIRYYKSLNETSDTYIETLEETNRQLEHLLKIIKTVASNVED